MEKYIIEKGIEYELHGEQYYLKLAYSAIQFFIALCS